MLYPLTKDQKRCFNLFEQTPNNYLLIGKPGVGKSVLINTLTETGRKSYTLAAPTGLAALNIGGKTLHSIFRIPSFEGIIPPNYNQFPADRPYNFIRYHVKALIIDEVSMVRADVLDYVDRCLRYVKEVALPFGGIQVIMVGDFFQLPPVTKPLAKKELNEAGYKSEFAFSAKVFAGNFKVVELTEVLRQKGDPQFIKMLHNARTGQVTPKELATLNKQLGNPGDLRISLTAANREADEINQLHLRKLTEPEIIFKCQEFGEWEQTPVERILRLKVGAHVLVKMNSSDRPPKHVGDWDSKVVNGTLGKIVEIVNELQTTQDDVTRNNLEGSLEAGDEAPEEDEIIEGGEKNEQQYVVIEMDKGGRAKIYPKRWEKKIKQWNPETERYDEKVVASFKQIPLALAWAISMHKSQGQTFDKLHIDAKKVFAAGQLYVAISRSRTRKGITLESKLDFSQFRVNKNVIYFHEEIEV